MKLAIIVVLFFLGITSGLLYSQVSCNTYMDAGPINRTTGYGEENVKSGLYQALAQRYNNMNGSINSVKFWGRVDPASGNATNNVKVVIYNENVGLPGVILGQTNVLLDSASLSYEVTAVFSPPISVSSNIIVSVEAVTQTTDNFFIRHNAPGDNGMGTQGDGQGLWLNLVKQVNTWYKNLANGDFSWDYDFLILPIKNTTITANFTYSTSNLTVTFMNTSNGASGYLWDFGDGNTSNSTSPVHTYSGTGTYAMLLKAFGTDSSCFDSLVDTLIITLTGLTPHEIAINNIKIISIDPSNQILTLTTDENTDVSIFNVLGKKVETQKLFKNITNEISISLFNKGIYLIKPYNNYLNSIRFLKQ